MQRICLPGGLRAAAVLIANVLLAAGVAWWADIDPWR